MIDMASEVMREAWRPKTLLASTLNRPMVDLRFAIASSKRFILDSSMSEFLGVLSMVPFDVAPERRHDVLSSMRHSARLPANKVFVQIDGIAFRNGLIAHKLKTGTSTHDAWGDDLRDTKEGDLIPNPAVLLEQLSEEAISMTYFCNLPDGKIMSVPFVWLYKTNDIPFPETKDYDFLGGALSHGVGLHTLTSERVIAVRHSKPIPERNKVSVHIETFKDKPEVGVTHSMVPELGGLVRYLFVFLATLNDVPTIKTEVRPSKGYLARGSYKKYLSHTVMTLELPRKSTMTTLAKRMIAMARRRWHQVEPHWRINKRPNGFVCEPSYKHLWSALDDSKHSYCATCGARRVWIVLPRGRGDPTLGVVRHNEVNVTHNAD